MTIGLQSRLERGNRAIWAAAALCLLPPLQSAAAQKPSQAQDTLRRQTFPTTVLSVDTARVVLSAPTASKVRELRLPAPLLQRLAPFRGRNFTALAAERPTPGGIQTAVVLTEAATPRAMAETIRDIQLLRPVDRGGIEVKLQPARDRKLVYEDRCKTVYNVPTAFTIGGSQVLLQPYETRSVTAANGSYTISLAASQFIVPKECSQVFEGSRSLIEYVIVRNS